MVLRFIGKVRQKTRSTLLGVLDGIYLPYISDVVSPLVVSITIIFKTNCVQVEHQYVIVVLHYQATTLAITLIVIFT